MPDQLKRVPLIWKLVALVGFPLAAMCACGTVIYLLLASVATPLLTDQQTQSKPVIPVDDTATPINKNNSVPNNEKSRIAFVKTNDRVGGEYDIYLMRPDGSDIRQLTSLPGLETSPAWSPNGQSIAFVATQDSVRPNDCVTGYVELRCNFEIYTISVDGSNLKRLTTLPSAYDRGPTWSPDGKHIAFSSREAGASYGYIYAIGVDGTGLTALTKGEVRDSAPSWSSNGKQIAFMRETCCGSGSTVADIYVMNADGTHVTRLTQGERPDGNPAWSPDGQYIAWMTEEGDAQNPIGKMAIMNADGTNQTTIPLDISVSIGYQPAWSPDSQQLMFVYREGNHLNLYRVNRDGTNLTKVTDDSAFFSAPAWSPNLAEP